MEQDAATYPVQSPIVDNFVVIGVENHFGDGQPAISRNKLLSRAFCNDAPAAQAAKLLGPFL